jgi:uncharacterized 2Fe-2S/4Fe-4S cluster protein (DUF4445 family)
MREQSAIPDEKLAEGWVLACHATISGDITVVEIPYQRRDSSSVLQHGHSTALPLQPALRKEYDAVSNQTLIHASNRCIGREPGDTCERLYGAAIDIGTTTVVASLVNLRTYKRLAPRTFLRWLADIRQRTFRRS